MKTTSVCSYELGYIQNKRMSERGRYLTVKGVELGLRRDEKLIGQSTIKRVFRRYGEFVLHLKRRNFEKIVK